MILTKRYLWLCLCLLFCNCCFSCVVFRNNAEANITARGNAQPGKWILKIRVLPGYDVLDLPVYSQFIDETSDPKEGFSSSIVLEYRFNSQEECRLAVDRALRSKGVSAVNIVKE